MDTPAVLLISSTMLIGTAAAVLSAADRPGYAWAKLLASSGYIAFALHRGALASPYGTLVLAGLLLSWLGDLFLTGRSSSYFIAGLAAFLLAHVAYASAFVVRGIAPGLAALAAGVFLVAGVAILRWLAAHQLPDAMRAPVVGYLMAIGVMVALAVGTGSGVLIVGALAFAVSDVLVARQRFVIESPANRLVGLPLYFAAQLLIASSI